MISFTIIFWLREGTMRIDLYTAPTVNLSGWRFRNDVEIKRFSDLSSLKVVENPSILIGSPEELLGLSAEIIEKLRPGGLRIIIIDARPGSPMPQFDKSLVQCILPHLEKREEQRLLHTFINNSIDMLLMQEQSRLTQHDLEELTWIGVLLSSMKDTDELLELILTKAREITSCDAGSLYLVEEHNRQRRLRFKMLQNDSIPLHLKEFVMPLDEWSLAGYAAITEKPLIINDAYDIDERAPYSHHRWIDKKNNYRTITMLAVPLKNLKEEVVGVLQLINRKRKFNVLLSDPLTALVEVIPFDARSIRMVTSLASHAAVTLEKNMLYESIQQLFEGFVQASITAIESRDPTTSGHSQRVSELTVKLAEAVDAIDSGALADVRFSEEDIREIRYAGLLHDFGKVGVRENILVKEKKLYPEQETTIRSRGDKIRSLLELEKYKRLNQLLLESPDNYERHRDETESDINRRIQALEDDLGFLWQCNVPRMLEGDSPARLKEIAEYEYLPEDPGRFKLITPEEADILAIQRGNLSWEEMQQIREHSTFSYIFLKEIPWTKELRNVPEIAYSHHEFIDRTGYPRRLYKDEIPIQARMMTISDIYDALTASDRPYKKAAPTEVALRILNSMADEGKLDRVLLDLFIEKKIYTAVQQNSGQPA